MSNNNNNYNNKKNNNNNTNREVHSRGTQKVHSGWASWRGWTWVGERRSGWWAGNDTSMTPSSRF